jgi:UDP-2,3-diacylglucosamine pyrophosphatase LpxH
MAARALWAAMLLVAILGCAGPGAAVAQSEGASLQPDRRQAIVISDLHFGLGRTAPDKWDPREDFRWTKALAAFLDSIGKSGGDKVDLVIAGDFLELWQPPDNLRCNGGDDATCSVDQMLQVVRHVVAQHSADLKLLGDFAKRGDNRLIVIPGNHDAALLVPELWSEVAKALGASAGRVILVTTGVWSSVDGQLVIEHGHQIGADVNAFAEWPAVVKSTNGTSYLQSPWGERFVQKLFNQEEKRYPIIDNLSPESYGARLRLADRGLWGSIADVARFIAFNLFEASLAQKGQSLGTEATEGKPCTRPEAEALGYRLFASALPPGDPFKAQLEGNSEQALALQKQLTDLTKTLSDEELAQICRQRTSTGTLGGLLESTFVPRQDVLRTHLQMRLTTFPKMKVFVYAHTHQLEPPWNLRLGLGSSVSVLNTGAFQRLVDERGFRRRLEQFKLTNPADGLSQLALESLAPCYSFVEVPRGIGSTRSMAATKLWKMSETDSRGTVLDPGDDLCR